MTTAQRLTITFDMVPPPVVVEVVAGDRKRQQYAAQGIPEYWLIDPQEQAIVLLTLEQPHTPTGQQPLPLHPSPGSRTLRQLRNSRQSQ